MLFNVAEDIRCQKNVAEQHPDVVGRLMGLADQARADLGDLGKPGAGQRPVGRFENPTPRTLPSPKQ
jgi:arylsulfatase